jgi:hypothetical protein
MSATREDGNGRSFSLRRALRRGPWENAATMVIALGVAMLCQPFFLTLYTYSFGTILVGSAMFTIVTKFPD